MWIVINQKQKAPVDNAEKDKRKLIPLPKIKLNLCKHKAIYFQSLAYFCIALSVIAPSTILVDRH